MPKNNSGFTLIELLVVVSLIGLMAAVTIPIFGNFNRAQTLNQTVKKLKTDIRSAQNKSLSSVKSKTGSLPRAWGIKIVLDDQGRASSYQIINCLRDSNFGNVPFICADSESKNLSADIAVDSIQANGANVPNAVAFYLVFDLLSGKSYYQAGSSPAEVASSGILIQLNYAGESGGPVVTVGPGGMIQD